MNQRPVAAAGPRRAPRLGPKEHLAPHITRVGRFRERDPLESRPPPGIWRWLGVAGWAALLGGSVWRAYRAVRPDQSAAET